MKNKKVMGAVAAGAIALGGLAPVTASAHPHDNRAQHQGAGPRHLIGQEGRELIREARESNPEALEDFRAAVKAAKSAKREAVRAAKSTFREATEDARQTLKEALSAADSREERREARKAFREATVDERAELRSAKKTARAEFRVAVEAALDDLKGALATTD